MRFHKNILGFHVINERDKMDLINKWNNFCMVKGQNSTIALIAQAFDWSQIQRVQYPF